MILTKENFILYAMKCYDNPNCTGTDEFYEDIKKFQYIKKSFRRKHLKKFFNFKLTLNHIITLYNLFGNKATEMLFLKIEKDYWIYLKPFIVFLNFMPEKFLINNEEFLSSDINMDEEIVHQLREI